MVDATAGEDGITAQYYVANTERVLEFDHDGRAAAVVQNVGGHAILKVHPTAEGDELEYYHDFDVVLDHITELLGASLRDLPAPEGAVDMGM